MGGVLAIDPGTKKTGFAVADALRISSQPLDVCAAGEADPALLRHIEALLAERDISVLLVGLPLGPDGGEGQRARAVRVFLGRLVERFPGREVVAWNETLTTKEAELQLREAGYRGAAARERRDSWSALVLLRDWLDSGEPRA